MTRNRDNNFGTARDFGRIRRNRTARGAVNRQDPVDFFEFDLTRRSRLTVRSHQRLDSPLVVRLFNESRDFIGRIRFNRGSSGKRLRENLPAGTYFMSVRGQGAGSQYRLRLRSRRPNRSSVNDDDLINAQDLGILSGSTTRSDIVSKRDPVDFYQFRLTQNSDLDINFTGRRSSVAVDLIHDANNNNRIDRREIINANSGTESSVFEALPAGDYFIRVQPTLEDTSTRYDLNLVETAQPSNVSPEPGNSVARSLDLGVLSGTRILNDYVGAIDHSDYYQFTLNENSEVQVSFAGSPGSLGVDLILDANRNGMVDGSEILSSRNLGVSELNSNFTKSLPNGTYLLRVQSSSANRSTHYELTVAETPQSDNTLATAQDLGSLSGSAVRSDVVNMTDSVDFYRLTLNQNSNLEISFAGDSSAVAVDLIADLNNNNRIDSGEVIAGASGLDNTFLEALPTGNYFVRVQPALSNASTQYNLTLIDTPQPETIAPDPGETISQSANLGVVSGTRILNDYVGTVDNSDYYQFSLSHNSDVRLSFTGDPGSLSVDLIFDANNNGSLDGGEIIASESLSFSETSNSLLEPLPSGTYFVRVQSSSAERSTHYQLTVEDTPRPATLFPDPGSTLAESSNLGVLANTLILNDYVGVVDPIDTYQFTLNQASNLQVNFAGDAGSLAVDLIFDANGNGFVDAGEIFGSDRLGFSETNDGFAVPLLVGTYFVQVRPGNFDPSTQYELTLRPII